MGSTDGFVAVLEDELGLSLDELGHVLQAVVRRGKQPGHVLTWVPYWVSPPYQMASSYMIDEFISI